MPVKSYQFFKITRKEREKNAYAVVNEKRKTEKSCFITDFFIKSFNLIINHFLYRKLIRGPIFAFGYQIDARNIKRGIKEKQITRNGKLQYLFQKQFQSFSTEHNTNKFFLMTNCAYMTFN